MPTARSRSPRSGTDEKLKTKHDVSRAINVEEDMGVVEHRAEREETTTTNGPPLVLELTRRGLCYQRENCNIQLDVLVVLP